MVEMRYFRASATRSTTPRTYVDPGLIDEWEDRDPIDLFRDVCSPTNGRPSASSCRLELAPSSAADAAPERASGAAPRGAAAVGDVYTDVAPCPARGRRMRPRPTPEVC